MEKRDPGRSKKKLREEDWRQKWYDAVESESYSSIGVWEAYEAATSTTTPLMKTVERPFFRKKFTQRTQRRESSKYGGRKLSYSQETEEQLVQWVLEMRDLHLPVSVVQVKEKARQNITVTGVACWIRRKDEIIFSEIAEGDKKMEDSPML